MSQIAGFQVVSRSGKWFSPANHILSLDTATRHLGFAVEDPTSKDEEWFLGVVLMPDSEGMLFERPLMNTEDQYSTLCLSSAHLSPEDCLELKRLGESDEKDMFWTSDFGWLVKFYFGQSANLEEFIQLNTKPSLSANYHKIIETAYLAGFGMIDFDSDAEISPHLISY